MTLAQILLAASLYLYAQSAPAEVSGIVYEGGDVPLGGVTIELIAGELRLTQMTGADGRFRLCCLPERHFQIVFRDEESSTSGEFTLTAPPASPFYVIATLDTTSTEGWRVREAISPENTPDPSTRTYWRADYARLPSTLQPWTLLGQTEISATVQRFDIAGMHGDEVLLFGSRGGSWSQNKILWNGFRMTTGDGTTLSVPDLSATESMTYDAGSAGPSSPGAVLLLQPRRGDSTLHGQAHIFLQAGALQNVNVTPRLRSFGITESDERYRYFAQGNLQLGGPLSSRWTYFGSASRLQMEKWIRNHLLPVTSNLTSENVHVSGDLTARSRLGLVWLGQQASQPQEGASPQAARESTRDTSRTFQSLQASWTHTISPRSFFDARAALSIGRTDAAFQPGVSLPAGEDLFPGFVDIPIVPSAEGGREIVALLNHVHTGAAPLAAASRDRSLQARTQFHAFRNGPGTMTHRLSFGNDIEWLAAHERTEAFQNMHLRLFRGAADSVKLLNPSDARNGGAQVQAYAADTVSMGALTFSFSGQANWAWGSNRKTLGSGASKLRWRNFAGRAGVAYRFGQRYPTVLRAALAHRPREALIRALKAVHPDGPGAAIHRWNDTNQDGSFQSGELGLLTRVEGSSFTRPDSALKQPYAHEVDLEASQELPGKLVLSLHAFRRVEHQVLALVNTGVPSSAYDAVAVFDPGNDGASQTGDEAWVVAYNQHPGTLGQDTYVLTNPSDASGFSEGYEARVAYTRARLQWELAFTQYRAVARTAPGNGPRQNDWSVLAVINDPNESINAYGSTFFDRGLGARFWGTWQPGWNIRFSWITSYLDGAPYGRILPVDGLNQGLIGILATRRGPGDGSVSDGKRTVHNITTDLRLLRGFRLSRGRLDATLDVFNVFNVAHALQEADVTSPNHLWRIPLSFQTPRSLQVGLRFTW
jgi:hypothetical protein